MTALYRRAVAEHSPLRVAHQLLLQRLLQRRCCSSSSSVTTKVGSRGYYHAFGSSSSNGCSPGIVLHQQQQQQHNHHNHSRASSLSLSSPFGANTATTTTTSTAGATRSHYTYSSPGSFGEDDNDHHSHDHHNHSHHHNHHNRRNYRHRGYTVGIGGPVGSGKTALVLQLCRNLPQLELNCHLGVVTNDIFTQEDAEFLTRHEALPTARIRAVETGGCPHAAIREDVSSNLTALEELTRSANHHNKNNNNNTTPSSQSQLPCLLLCESGGDNLAANFSRELADLTLYVIDVAGGDKVPRKGGPGITQSDLLIINKIDLADAVGADLQIMQRDATRMRTSSTGTNNSNNNNTTVGPTLLAAVKHGQGVPEICDFILQHYRQAMATMIREEEQELREK